MREGPKIPPTDSLTQNSTNQFCQSGPWSTSEELLILLRHLKVPISHLLGVYNILKLFNNSESRGP